MGKVICIPAKRRVGNITGSGEEKQKLRVAAYCRVSTDSDEQATSYEMQVEHYTDYISKQPDWQLAGIFADDGISGTNTKKREEFNRMIAECMDGKIDMVITKSISRFARNTLDCLKYIQQLKTKNVPVFFEKENINTMDAKGEVLLTIMASLAQQESESLSKNVKLGLQFRYQNGKVQVNHNHFLGYTKDEKGNLIVEPEEAKVIRRIYREFLEGRSLLNIARGLMADGILTGGRKKKWSADGIRMILGNEKYMGDALLQKTYTVDVLTKRRVVNNGIVPQYYVEDNHEAIIPREVFMQVQDELHRRANLQAGGNGRKRIYSSKYALSSRVYCGCCGDLFQRVTYKGRVKKYISWKCATRQESGARDCKAEMISEERLQNTVIRAINKVLGGKRDVLDKLRKNVSDVIIGEDGETEEAIDDRIQLLKSNLVKAVGNREKISNLSAQVDELRAKKQQLFGKNVKLEAVKQRANISVMEDFIQRQVTRITEFDETLVRRLIEKITIYDDKFVFVFKSGLKLDLKR